MLNEIFKQYKNKYSGQTAVLVGGGPSIDNFKPIDDAIYAGVNLIGKHNLFNQSLDQHMKLDYFFFGDRNRHMQKDFKVKKAKFGACIVDGQEHSLHLTLNEVQELGANGMEISNKRPVDFPEDISSNAIYGHTVVMAGLQFLVYCGVSKIYLVGMDCSGSHCFNDIHIINGSTYTSMIVDWDNAKKWLNEKHPEIEIISINPVGLKGYFKDIYQND